MRHESDIRTTLNKRRRNKFLDKLCIFFLLVIIFVSVVASISWLDYFRINSIEIIGANNVSKLALEEEISEILSERFIYVFSRDNILFMPRVKIKNALSGKFDVIESSKILFAGKNAISVEIRERTPKALWCMGTVRDIGDCYYIDKTGLVYLRSPNITANSFIRYFGVITGDPVGKKYLDSEVFKKMYSFNESLGKLQLEVREFSVNSSTEFQSILAGKAVIVVNDKIDLNIALGALESIIREGVIRADPDSLAKIKSIDLRFGNKIPIDYRD